MISLMCRKLAQELTLRGHHVTVATSWPQYNLDEESANKTFSEYAVEDRVDVIRVRAIPHHKVNMIVRGISELTLPFLYLRKIKKLVRHKIDAVIVYSPPLTLAFVGTRIKKKSGARYLLNIQDIFPQNAIDLGIIRNTLLIRFFEWMERKAYREADKLTSHTEGGRKFLTDKKHVPPTKVSTVSNWIDLSRFDGVKPTGIFRERYGLERKFIFLFAGIMGPSQNLDFIIHIAQRVVDMPDICFVFVGDGMEKKRLQRMVEAYDLYNVKFQPFVSQDEYPFLVKEMDVGLVCLNNRNRVSVMPGKILGFMAASIPIVAFLNKENDGHELIRKAQCGYSAISDEPEKAASLVLKVFEQRNKIHQLGRNGYNYAAANCSKKVCIDELEQLLQRELLPR